MSAERRKQKKNTSLQEFQSSSYDNKLMSLNNYVVQIAEEVRERKQMRRVNHSRGR